jgi:hypothetical protein
MDSNQLKLFRKKAELWEAYLNPVTIEILTFEELTPRIRYFLEPYFCVDLHAFTFPKSDPSFPHEIKYCLAPYFREDCTKDPKSDNWIQCEKKNPLNKLPLGKFVDSTLITPCLMDLVGRYFKSFPQETKSFNDSFLFKHFKDPSRILRLQLKQERYQAEKRYRDLMVKAHPPEDVPEDVF